MFKLGNLALDTDKIKYFVKKLRLFTQNIAGSKKGL